MACHAAVSLLGAVRLDESMRESSEQTSYTLVTQMTWLSLLSSWGISLTSVGEGVQGLEVEKEGPRGPC